jgi:hypothetical protein
MKQWWLKRIGKRETNIYVCMLYVKQGDDEKKPPTLIIEA